MHAASARWSRRRQSRARPRNFGGPAVERPSAEDSRTSTGAGSVRTSCVGPPGCPNTDGAVRTSCGCTRRRSLLNTYRRERRLICGPWHGRASNRARASLVVVLGDDVVGALEVLLPAEVAKHQEQTHDAYYR